MQRGPKPKNNKVHVLTGGKVHPQLSAKKVKRLWSCPFTLKTEGQKFRSKIGKILIDREVITELDRYSFDILCKNFQQIHDADKVLDAEGLTVDGREGKRRHPVAMIRNKAVTEFRQLAAEFGLFPSSRDRLGVDLSEKIDADEEFLFGK